ncbi:MAG TPA: ubiquitin-like domain-containing protein [Candidatus Saccharimonadales bacterium]|nr:ubiquitin-like domain-containing protein [Candidatus Saccharimonadales bacterium]
MRRKNNRYTIYSQKLQRARRLGMHEAAKHPFAVPVATLLGLLVITGAIMLFLNRGPAAANPNVVVISYDDQKQVVSSKEPTVRSLLQKLDLRLSEGDVVEPGLDTEIQQDDFRINVYRAVPVEIIDDGGQKTFALSARTTERSVASQAGLTIYPEDKLTKAPITDFVASGGISEQVIIDRAQPVDVNLYGSPVTLRTHAQTVGELLEERKVRLAAQDQVTPGLDTPLAAAGRIAVVRNGLTTVTVEEEIAMPVQAVADNTLAYGTSAIRQKGAPGKKAVVYEVNTQNGVEVARRPIQQTVVVQPVAEIRVTGSNLSGIKGDMARAGIAPGDYQYVDYIVQKESGWNPVAQNRSSGAYGLCQALPGSKMASAGSDWQTNPVTQLRWCNSYAVGRYGTWQAAYNFWVRNHWW